MQGQGRFARRGPMVMERAHCEHPIAIGSSRRRSEAAMLRSRGMVATSVATQALPPGTRGRHWMESVPFVSSHDGPGRVQLEGFSPTRNRKVVDFESDLGLQTAGQSTCTEILSLAWLASLIILAFDRPRGRTAPLCCIEFLWLIETPSMGLLRRPTPGEIVEDGRPIPATADIGASGSSKPGKPVNRYALPNLTKGGQPWRSSKFVCPIYPVNRRPRSSSPS
jgi:hypothetical protein